MALLSISPHTVQEHLESIFAVGVRSPRELVGKVFLRHHRTLL